MTFINITFRHQTLVITSVPVRLDLGVTEPDIGSLQLGFSPGHMRLGYLQLGLLGSQVGNLLKDRHFLVILAVCALAVGAQVTVMLLGVTFLIQAKQSTLSAAGSALSLFAVCMVLGRLACSRLTLSIRYSTIIITLLWLQAATLLLAWQGSGWFAILAIALSGFTFSGIFPTALALTGVLFPHVEGSALGILSTMGSLGSVVLCWLTGYVADLTDMGRGFMVIILACISALVLFQINYRVLNRRESLPNNKETNS